MKRIFTTLVMGATVVTFLVACSSELSLDAAGKKYLDTVCPINVANEKMTAAAKANDLPGLLSAAAQARDSSQLAAKTFSDTSIVWPAGMRPLLDTLKSETLSRAQYYDLVSQAKSISAATSVNATGSSSTAAQEVRMKLNLSADTSASCSAYK